jgi:hypothetical protein
MHGQSTSSRLVSPSQEPTAALPGSEQKIRVMMERAARRQQLFHPQDGLVGQSGPQLAALPDASTWLARLAAYQFLTFDSSSLDDDDVEDDMPPIQQHEPEPPINPTSKAS